MTKPTSSPPETSATKQQNLQITPEQEAQLNWLKNALGASNIEETILRSITVIVTLKQHLKPGSELFLHNQEEQIRLLIPELEAPPHQEEWQYLVSRPHPWRKQLYIKGRKLRAFSVWRDMIVNELSLEEAADNWDLPLAAVSEAIGYCESHQELLKLEAEEEGYRLAQEGVSVEPKNSHG